MKHTIRVAAALWVCQLPGAPVQAGVAPDERWRVTGQRAAPWADESATQPRWVGRVWRSAGSRWTGPPLPDCGLARHRFVHQGPEGWFQGALPAPAASAARSLGLSPEPVLTHRIDCANASIDLHLVAPDRALTAVDGQLLELQRLSVADSPLAAAARLLWQHFHGDMAFTPESVEAKAGGLTARLRHDVRAYWAAPRRADEAPEINGDPFTNSQEYPQAFEFGLPRRDGRRAEVPVHFDGDGRTWRVSLVMRRHAGSWRLDDIRYDDGSRFRDLLRRR